MVPSPSHFLLLIDEVLVLRNVVLQMLDFVLQRLDSFLKLRLEAVRGAFAGGDSLPVDHEERAGLGWAVVVVEGVVDASLPGARWPAGELEGGGLGFAAAFEVEDVVVTHG